MSDVSPGSAFAFPGRSATPIALNISTTSPVAIAGDAASAVQVAWFQITETTGATPNCTLDVWDGTTAVVFHALAPMTARQELFYGRGFWLNPGQFLRVTMGTANTASATGLATLPGQQQ